MASSKDSFPYTPQLRSLMQQAGIPSFAALAQQAGVSTWQIDQMRRGSVLKLRVGAIARLSHALDTSISNLIATFSGSPPVARLDLQSTSKAARSESPTTLQNTTLQNTTLQNTTLQNTTLQKEYERLQRQVERQTAEAVQSCQRAALLQLEPLLEKLPVFLNVIEQNPDFPARQLVPHLRPLERLLTDWDVTTIAPIGSEAGYDPQKHELMEASRTAVQPGDRIRVRFAGYYWGDRLLFRAKVSPVQPNDAHPS
ncbi:nucleotide exchange factor GrpE [Thermoleptolyngbya sichuanensis A183]|uniref:Nucleotide exchange factor GrpE n=1 Tax=Thermoleptolyngbya sichuanensis A183 TaxID=2737172 RepID=A0A6M8BIN2_9CYAN|nr:nucleotide exchange factor GrpE [Thermoleptolyngbya sichuanensis]QKD84040.1 nucleotide exchange factor GrpE [Thermoleptolyngbya sichuanensis A183]